MESHAKLARLTQLRDAWSSCRACQLSEHRKSVVFGYGNVDADLLVLGETPGAQEDEQGAPFVGPAGILLDQYLGQVSDDPEVVQACTAINQAKEEDQVRLAQRRLRELLLRKYYFANIVCCRPEGNRDPAPGEIAACRPRLLEQIYTIDPLMILAVGGVALQALLGKKMAITTSRGELFDIEIPGRETTYTIPVFAILHTAYLLRTADFGVGSIGEKTYYDVLRAHVILDGLRMRHDGITPPALRPRLRPGK